MYSVYADGVCIYNDAFALDNMKLASPKLTLEDNAAGSFMMTVPPSNLGYSTIVRMVTDIAVHKDGKEIWAGRVLSENEDFYRNRVLTCEGELAFFNDSTQPPAEYAGGTIREYLEAMIAIHNAKVGDNRKFTIGIVTVVDEEFPTYYTNYEKTITILNALVTQYGGHLRVRKEDGVRYLDYLADYPDTCSQTIQFGSNLIEHTKGWDMTEFATVIVPLGNRLDKSEIEALDAYLTVESVNEGSLYVQSPEAVEAYGCVLNCRSMPKKEANDLKIAIKSCFTTLVEDTTLIQNAATPYPVEFAFSKDWDGFAKTAFFEAGGVSMAVVLSEDKCDIPGECLKKGGIPLKIAIYGVKGEERKSTGWHVTSKILFPANISVGTGGSGEPMGDEAYKQIMGIIGDPSTAGFGDKTLTEVIVEIQRSISGTASDEEVDDMLDDAFASDDPGGSTSDNTASDKEVDDLLNDVFGEQP